MTKIWNKNKVPAVVPTPVVPTTGVRVPTNQGSYQNGLASLTGTPTTNATIGTGITSANNGTNFNQFNQTQTLPQWGSYQMGMQNYTNRQYNTMTTDVGGGSSGGSGTTGSTGNGNSNGSGAGNTSTGTGVVTNGGTVTPTPTTPTMPMSYEEWVNAYTQQADAQRQKAIIDAQVSYKQNMATYGANAERMASMGLTGSGYSDYVNSQAYATSRAEVAQANSTYYNNLMEAQKEYALKAEETYQSLLGSLGELNINDINAYIGHGLSQETASQLIKQKYMSGIDQGSINFDGLNEFITAKNNGQVAQADYDEVIKNVNSNIQSNIDSFFTTTDNGSKMSTKEAQESLANLEKLDYIDEATKQAVREQFYKDYPEIKQQELIEKALKGTALTTEEIQADKELWRQLGKYYRTKPRSGTIFETSQGRYIYKNRKIYKLDE